MTQPVRPLNIPVRDVDAEPWKDVVPTRIHGGGVESQRRRYYDVGPERRVLINMELESAAAPITLIQNWNPDKK